MKSIQEWHAPDERRRRLGVHVAVHRSSDWEIVLIRVFTKSDIIQVMTRRDLLAAAMTAAVLPAKTKIGRSSISAISDEIGRSPQASIDFAKQYKLQFLELRDVPGSKGKEYSFLPEAEWWRRGKQPPISNATEFAFPVLMNSSLLKFAWPGTELGAEAGGDKRSPR